MKMNYKEWVNLPVEDMLSESPETIISCLEEKINSNEVETDPEVLAKFIQCFVTISVGAMFMNATNLKVASYAICEKILSLVKDEHTSVFLEGAYTIASTYENTLLHYEEEKFKESLSPKIITNL